jgi:uncharacterized protein YrrD
MQFTDGANVYTASGDRVGDIDRVVLDPKTKEVSHIVVRKGLIFNKDKIVPIDLIAFAAEDHVVLREDAGDLERLPDFEEERYIVLDETELARAEARSDFPTPLYPYFPTYGTGYGAGQIYPTSPPQPYIIQTELNIPEGEVALEEGAKVISADGEQVGNVEKVLTDAQADRATNFVVSEGLLLKERKLIPVAWVDRVYEDEVHLAVGSTMFEVLREYRG